VSRDWTLYLADIADACTLIEDFTAGMSLEAFAADALVFHARNSLRRQDRWARWQAGASLLIWLAVIAAGRMIAYV